MELLTCSKCAGKKTSDEFPAKGRACKACRAEALRAWRRAHPEKVKTSETKWKSTETGKGYQRAYRSRNARSSNQREAERRYAATDAAKGNQLRYRRNKNDKSRETAERAGREWTGWEYEMLADPSRSIASLAALLGRTRWAISTQRHLLSKGDPKTVLRAGLDPVSEGVSAPPTDY